MIIIMHGQLRTKQIMVQGVGSCSYSKRLITWGSGSIHILGDSTRAIDDIKTTVFSNAKVSCRLQSAFILHVNSKNPCLRVTKLFLASETVRRFEPLNHDILGPEMGEFFKQFFTFFSNN